MQIITALIILLVIVLLIKQGNKIINRKPGEQTSSDQNWLEELRNIQSIQIKVVSSGEIYRYILGSYIIFWALCLGAVTVFCFETSVIALFTHSQGVFNILGILFMTFAIGLLYTIFSLPIFWKYAFFKKAIAPNLKHGEFILGKLARIGRAFLITTFFVIFIASAFPLYSKSGDEFFGLIFITAFVAFLLCGVGFSIFIDWEMERLGLPHLLEGIKQLTKKRREVV